MKHVVLVIQRPKPLPKVFTYGEYLKYQTQLKQYKEQEYYARLTVSKTK